MLLPGKRKLRRHPTWLSPGVGLELCKRVPCCASIDFPDSQLLGHAHLLSATLVSAITRALTVVEQRLSQCALRRQASKEGRFPSVFPGQMHLWDCLLPQRAF